jgi:hypothetical protein
MFFGIFDLNGQTVLSQEEIISSWKSNRVKEKFADVTFDKKANSRIEFIADSLNRTGNDSIMIYGISYPGSTFIGLEKCIAYFKAYIIWPSNGNLNGIFLKGSCEFYSTSSDSSGLFTFYNKNKESIEMEDVMPVIFKAERNKENVISYSISYTTHEPKYYLHLKIGERLKLLSFSEDDIQNTESLFYDYNQSLKSTQLWNLIKIEVEKSFPSNNK